MSSKSLTMPTGQPGIKVCAYSCPKHQWRSHTSGVRGVCTPSGKYTIFWYVISQCYRPTWYGSWTGMDRKECYRLTHPCRKFLATPLLSTSIPPIQNSASKPHRYLANMPTHWHEKSNCRLVKSPTTMVRSPNELERLLRLRTWRFDFAVGNFTWLISELTFSVCE